MHKLKEPHVFNASTNPFKLITNLSGIFTEADLDKIRREIDANVISLYRLGESHYNFARTIDNLEWRQRISRLYYGAYNARRAVSLKHDGSFSTDSTDHQKVDHLPDTFNGAAQYRAKLKNLREDRNLADYSHLAIEDDLLVATSEYGIFVGTFLNDAKDFLKAKGIAL